MHRKDLLDEQTYDRERADEFVWERTRKLGLSRRKLMQLLAGGTGAAAVGLVSSHRAVKAAEDDRAIIKPASPELFFTSGSNLEMRWENMYNRGYIVPNEMFFVRNNSRAVPKIDPATWRLQVEGSGVERPRSFTYDEILSMPSVSVFRALECAGNGRNLFQVSHGKKIPGTEWNMGAIGVAEWTGVPLREVLERAGVKRAARDVMPEGLDDKKVKRPISLEKAMADDTLLVYAMNGEQLPPDHGFPIRLLVPGWVGIAHIKWVGRIEVSEQPLYSEYNTKRYVLIGADYKPEAPALGLILTSQKVKSVFELPWKNAELPAGKHLLRGRAWSGEGHITEVEVSLDDGRTWQKARLREPNISQAWVRWDLEWNARPGTYKLQARATDNKGNQQPFKIPFNEEGYSHWAVVTHPVQVR